MSDNQSWPPPPDTPNLLAIHDKFLTALLRAPASKPPLSRLRLIRDLHKETGTDFRQCMAIVNNFCDRHAILMSRRGPVAWIGCLPSLIQLLTVAAMQGTWFFLERAHDAAPTRIARRAITAERIHLDFVFLGIIFICVVFQLRFVFGRAKQARLDAADARKKMSERSRA